MRKEQRGFLSFCLCLDFSETAVSGTDLADFFEIVKLGFEMSGDVFKRLKIDINSSILFLNFPLQS